MKITTLVENTCLNYAFEVEHGLSLYIETEDMNILFDMGQSDLFLKNAESMGVDLKNVDVAVLSHGHYDHGGGLGKFLEINKKARVYVHKDAFEPHFNGTEKYIGLDAELMNSDRLIFTEDRCEINDKLSLYSCNEREKEVEFGSFGLNVKRNGALLPDDFSHEQYLMIEENSKRVLISGCSHKGIINIAKWFKPDVLVGGFHFSKLKTDERLEGYAKELDKSDTWFYTCHCTGCEQFEFMKKHMKRLGYLSTGDRVII